MVTCFDSIPHLLASHNIHGHDSIHSKLTRQRKQKSQSRRKKTIGLNCFDFYAHNVVAIWAPTLAYRITMINRFFFPFQSPSTSEPSLDESLIVDLLEPIVACSFTENAAPRREREFLHRTQQWSGNGPRDWRRHRQPNATGLSAPCPLEIKAQYSQE